MNLMNAAIEIIIALSVLFFLIISFSFLFKRKNKMKVSGTTVDYKKPNYEYRNTDNYNKQTIIVKTTPKIITREKHPEDFKIKRQRYTIINRNY